MTGRYMTWRYPEGHCWEGLTPEEVTKVCEKNWTRTHPKQTKKDIVIRFKRLDGTYAKFKATRITKKPIKICFIGKKVPKKRKPSFKWV